MNIDNAIEIRNMSKKFRIQHDKPQTLKERLVFSKNKVEYHEVLKNIDLDIKKGDTVALIGTNGSGKSTLLKLMTKIIYPQSGSIKTNGKLTSLLELGAGFHPDFTGRENIYFNASIFGLTRKEIENRVDDIIEFSELGEFIDNPIRTYSSGMYMRLAFSIAINVDAEILLIDEILAVGDQHFTDKCYARLKELRDSDKTIVIVTHSLDVVRSLCNRAIWLYKGEFKLDGDPTYVIQEYLKQVRLDHKEIQQAKLNNKDESFTGISFIDLPKNYAKVTKNMKSMDVRGWALSDVPELIVRLEIDGEVKEGLSFYEREDVLMAYEEQYGIYDSNNMPGWHYTVNLEEYDVGIHHIVSSVLDLDGKVLSEKDVFFEVVE